MEIDTCRSRKFLCKIIAQQTSRQTPSDLTENETERKGVIAGITARFKPGRLPGKRIDDVIPVMHGFKGLPFGEPRHSGLVQQHVSRGDPGLARLAEFWPIGRHRFVEIELAIGRR